MSDDKPPIVPPKRPNAGSEPAPSMLDHVIPAKNPDSLLAYYFGLFAIIPFLGLGIGPFSIWKGSSALKRCKEDPALTGKTHAMVGIGCGAIGLLFNLLIAFVTVGLILNAFSKR